MSELDYDSMPVKPEPWSPRFLAWLWYVVWQQPEPVYKTGRRRAKKMDKKAKVACGRATDFEDML